MHTLVFTHRKLDTLTAQTAVHYTVVDLLSMETKTPLELYNLLTRSWDEIIIEVQDKKGADIATQIVGVCQANTKTPVTYLRPVGCPDQKVVAMVALHGCVVTVDDNGLLDTFGAFFLELTKKTHKMGSVLLTSIIETMVILQNPESALSAAWDNACYTFVTVAGLVRNCHNHHSTHILVPALEGTRTIHPGENMIVGYYEPCYFLPGSTEVHRFVRDGSGVLHARPLKDAETQKSPVEPAEEAVEALKEIQGNAGQDAPCWEVVNKVYLPVRLHLTGGTMMTLESAGRVILRGMHPTFTSHNRGDKEILLPVKSGENEVIRVKRL